MNRFTGKVAIVTGGGNGIGRAIALRLAEEGAAIAIVDLEAETASATADAIRGQGGTAIFHTGDVSDPATANAAVAKAVQSFGRVDVMVCNAGVTDKMAFLDVTPEFFERILSINLKGALFFAQAAAKRMIDQGDGGRILTVASNSGVFGGRGRAAYGASKAGMINLVQTMAIELAEYGITSNAVGPGPTRTRVTSGDVPPPSVMARMPMQRFGAPEEIAAVAAFLASDEASFVTGQLYMADGGYTTAGMMEG